MTSVRLARAFGFPLLAVLVGACLASPLHALAGFAWTRDVDVPAAGWVRVPLDIAAIRHMAPGGADLHVISPGGESIPFRLSAAPPGSTPGLIIETRGAPCRLASTSSICTLDVPAGQVLRRLTVEVQGPGPVGFRLHAPAESRWELLAEGVWQGGGIHALAGEAEPVAGSALRLELHGPGGPRVAAYALDLAEPTVSFQAPGPGRYLLAYGGIGSEPESARRPPAQALWLLPGPEQQGEPPRLPAGPAAPLDPIRFSNVWEISAPDAEPGDLVRLELPAMVYGPAREDLGDLRLAAGGRQVPFFRWSPPDPAFAGGEPELEPSDSDRAGESRVLVSLPSEGLPLTQIHLSAVLPAFAPLRRRVTVSYAQDAAASSTWECVPEPPLPCRERLELSGPAPRLLTIRLRDGDNPRLSALGVTVWRRRDVLLFVWPRLEEEGVVRLLAGAEGLEAPRYDLAALGPALLGRPSRTAELRSVGAASEKPWWSRWVMPAGVTVAAAWLVWLLRRILSEA